MFLVSLNYPRVGHLWGGTERAVMGFGQWLEGIGTARVLVLDLERNLGIACIITYGGVPYR